MKKLLLILPFVFGCTKDVIKAPACEVQKTIAAGLSSAVAKALECSNAEQIQADILSSLGKANLCEQTTQGPVGDILCPIAVQQVTALIGSKVPVSWGCKLSDTSSVSQTLLAACKSVVPLSK